MIAIVARHVARHRVGSVLLGLLVALAVLAVCLAPRLLGQLADAELSAELAALSPDRGDLTGATRFGFTPPDADLFAPTAAALADVPLTVDEPLSALLGRPDWSVRFESAVASPIDAPGTGGPRLRLVVDLDWLQRIDIVEGALPSPRDPGDETGPVDVAISQAAADEFELAVGDELASTPADLRIAALYVPVDPAAATWQRSPDLLGPVATSTGSGGSAPGAAVYLPPESAASLFEDLTGAELRVWFPVQRDALTFAEAPQVLEQLRQLQVVGVRMPSGEQLLFQTGLVAAVERTTDRMAATTALLALVASAPAGALIAVLVLATAAAVAARRRALALASARGASPTRLRLGLAAEGVIIAVPATALGVVAAFAITSGADATVTIVSGAIVGALLPVLLAAWPLPTAAPAGRGGLLAGRRGRLTIEAIAVGLAVAAVVALTGRGLDRSTATTADPLLTVDPLLSAVPLLLALAAAVLALRIIPLPLLALQRLGRRSPGATWMLGAASAVRAPTVGLAAVLAILVGVSASVLAVSLAATVLAGIERGARAEVGADVRVDGASAAYAEELARVADPVAGIQVVPGVALRSGSVDLDVALVLADTAALHELQPSVPVLGPGEVAASDDVAKRLGDRVELDGVTARVVGAVAGAPVPDLTARWVLVDASWAVDVTGAPFAPQTVLADVPPGTVLPTTPPGATVLTVDDVAATTTARPVVAGLLTMLQVGGLAALALGTTAVVLAGLAAATARTRTGGVLRVLGAGPRQLRALVAWELAPVAALCGLVGTAVGVGIAGFVITAIDLRDLVGGEAAVTPVLPAIAIAGIAGVFAVVVVLVGLAAAEASRRVDPARVLRIGQE